MFGSKRICGKECRWACAVRILLSYVRVLTTKKALHGQGLGGRCSRYGRALRGARRVAICWISASDRARFRNATSVRRWVWALLAS